MWQSGAVLVSDFGSDRGKFVIYSFWKNAVLPICKSRSGFYPAWLGRGFRRVLARDFSGFAACVGTDVDVTMLSPFPPFSFAWRRSDV